MQLTTNKTGIPIFTDAGREISCAEGMHGLRRMGHSVDDIARMTGASPRTVEGWFQGRRAPRLDFLLKLKHAIDKNN